MRASRLAWLNIAFAASGVAGLVYETGLHRELARVFGVTAWATATVLAGYMGGLALGAALFGKLADRVKRPLLMYAALELGVGLCAALTPFAAHVLNAVFVHLAHGSDPSSGGLVALRLVLAAGFTLIPTLLMGATLPSLSRGRAPFEGDASRAVGWLYALNLLGAAGGAAVATYAALPNLGLRGTLACGAALNVLAALIAFGVDRASPEPGPVPAPNPVGFVEGGNALRLLGLLAAWSGFASFAFEVVWTHLLAIVVGTSAYAFGLMLAMFLIGLAAASLRVALGPSVPLSLARLGGVQVVLAAVVAATLPLWDHVPALFVIVGPHVTSFAGRELVKAAVTIPLVTLPAYVLGLFFPLLLRHAAAGAPQLATAVGRLTAVNTVGSVLGSLVTGFLILPKLGSHATLLILIVASCGVGAACFPRMTGRIAAAAVAVVALVLPNWNLGWLGAGSNVYFKGFPSAQDKILLASESVQSGLTTVSQAADGIVTLRSNGKFQGDNGYQRTAQQRFAQVPLLFATDPKRALVIGAGTGESLAVMATYPFTDIDLAELSPDIVQAARVHFAGINNKVFDNPRVHVAYADGRNYLELSDHPYYVVSIEITSIWIAGAADLYNIEFYQDVRAHLAPGGVLQQWVQLHHMSPHDLAVVLNSARKVFPHVVLFGGGGQGQMIASMQPLDMDFARAQALSKLAAKTPLATDVIGGDFLTLSGEVLLDESKAADFINEQARLAGVNPDTLVSSDDSMYLEYATPRNNALGDGESKILEAAVKPFMTGALPVVHAESPADALHASLAREVGTNNASPELQKRLEEAKGQGVKVDGLVEYVKAELAP